MRPHTLDEPILALITQILQRPPLRLGQKQRARHTRSHEQRKDLQNMLHEHIRPADILQSGEPNLRDDSTQLARGGADAVSGGSVTGGEDFARDDEGGGVGAEVLEEVGEAVERDEGALVAVVHHLVVPEAHAGEDNGEDSEAHELNGFASDLSKSRKGKRAKVSKRSRNETKSGEIRTTSTKAIVA